MSYSYALMKKKGSKNADAEALSGGKKESSLPNSARLSNPGHQVDMPTVMREKMEDSFGMDLSGVKLYENRAVADAGAEAVTQGSRIAFAPGKLDFSSTHGQALLGHEISHVASQARGEVKGSGFLNDSALEARADREGLQAARGESVTAGYGGASAALSNTSTASASGPMQAKSGRKARAKEDFESTQLLPSEEGWTDDDLFDAKMAQQEKSEQIAKDLEKDNDPDDLYYDEEFDKNGIITGNTSLRGRSKNFAAPKLERGFFKTTYDRFRTAGSHWFTPLRNYRNRKAMQRMEEEMQNMAVFNAEDLVDDDILMDMSEEEKKKYLQEIEMQNLQS